MAYLLKCLWPHRIVVSTKGVLFLKKKSSRLRERLKYSLEGLKENVHLLKVVAWPLLFIYAFYAADLQACGDNDLDKKKIYIAAEECEKVIL